ncbi:hypothetical protein [Nocardia amamiensis]|uniref:hypothetical protein n=1 Tax=Nocardia amamiensis TaxID=404578 RepID=UPI001C3FBFC3|nr:hypothetical protein [Nocardia amamiensis]
MITDPVGVMVTLILQREHTLDAATVTRIVESKAGGRAKRRRLAQALLDRPGVLDDGRSPAPRAVAELLIALKRAGAMRISAPSCTECGKLMRTIQRRGDNWYCRVCGPVPEPCAGCGVLRPVAWRDRDGGPRCKACPPDDDRDPIDIITAVIAAIDPTLPENLIADAVKAVSPQLGPRRRLAWTLEDHPELLTGAGANAPIPSVLRLIDRLCDAGSATVIHPACPACGRTIHLHRPIKGKWLCRNCTAKSKAQPCARCGVLKEPAFRDENGQPLCPNCLQRDPANHEPCSGCGRLRPVALRTADGPVCGSCRTETIQRCSICGTTAPCSISVATSQPWCRACRQRWIRCSTCGEVRPLRGGTLEQPLCATCTRPEPGFWHSCADCGESGRIHNGRRCARCNRERRLRELLGDEHGQIRAGLQTLYRTLIQVERPNTVDAWLRSNGAPAILRVLNSGNRTLSHETLDELPQTKSLAHLRSVLVSIGVLPHRDEHMARLHRWTTDLIATRSDPDERAILQRYAFWHVIHRLRRRAGDTDITHPQVVAAQAVIKGAATLLDWLHSCGHTLTTATQADLDAWLIDHRTDAGNFVRWARKNKLTQLDYAATRWDGPVGTIDSETRWEQARLLLHDNTIELGTRAAGLLVLLYAQHVTMISRLTVEQVSITDEHVLLRLGDEPIDLPEPVAELFRELVRHRRGHAVIGRPATTTWLFPGGRPGQPIGADRLRERLRQLGIHSGHARSSALFQLATELPAAILARMLGIHISVAANWQRVSSGDWMSYATDVSRRSDQQHPDPTR